MGFGLDLGSLVINLKMNTAQFDKQAKSLSPILKNIGSRATALGANISLKVTAPIVALGTASVFAFGQFDEAITKSTAIMSGVTAELRREMEKTALVISGSSTTSAKDLGDAYFFLASAGLSAKQSIAALATVNQFAVAGQFDMALATDLLTDAQTALGLASKDAAENQKELLRISDVLVKANTIANASVQQFAESLTADAATAARGFGSSLETTVAVLAAYASAGKKGAESGNLFGRAVRLLTKAQRENGEVFKKFGIDVIDETTGKYNSLIDIIAQMEEAFKDLTKPQRDAALELLGFAALAQKSITPLLGLSDAMKEYEASVLSAGGVTAEITEKQLKSFNSQMKILFNQVTNVAIGIGKLLAPVVLFLNKILKAAIGLWEALPSFIKITTLVILGLVAAIGPLLIAFGTLLTVVALIIVNLPVLALAFEAVMIVVAAGIGLITVGFTALASVLLPIIAVVLIVIAVWDDLVSIFNKVVGFLKSAFIPIWDALIDVVDIVIDIFSDLVSLIGSIVMPVISFLWNFIKTLLMPVFIALKITIMIVATAFRFIIVIVKLLLLAIKFIISGIQKLVNWWGFLRDKVIEVGGVIVDFIKNKLQGISDKIKDMTGGIIDFAAVFSTVGTFLTDVFMGVVEAIQSGVTNAETLIAILRGEKDPKAERAEKIKQNRARLLDKAKEQLDQRDEFRATAKAAREQGNIKVALEAERKAEGAQQAANALFRAQTTGEFKILDLSDPTKQKKKKPKTPEEQLTGIEKTLRDILEKSKKDFEKSKPTVPEKKVEQDALKTQTKFQQINLSRIGIGGVPTAARNENKGIEDRQDRTNELLESITVTGNPAVVAP